MAWHDVTAGPTPSPQKSHGNASERATRSRGTRWGAHCIDEGKTRAVGLRLWDWDWNWDEIGCETRDRRRGDERWGMDLG